MTNHRARHRKGGGYQWPEYLDVEPFEEAASLYADRVSFRRFEINIVTNILFSRLF